MKTIIFGILFVIVVALAVWRGQIVDQSAKTTDVSEETIEALNMGLIPADDAEEMLRNYEPIRVYLSEKLGMPVNIQVTSDYTAAIEAMRARHIDMAWFGPFSYIIAANIANAEAIVNGISEGADSATYRSVIVVRANSGIKTLADLKGKNFAFVDPASTSGNLIPRKIFIENGINPDTDFNNSYFAGTHNAVQYAIANGQVDGGADSDNSYQRMVAAGEIDPAVNTILYTSDPIPASPIAVRKDLPDALKQRIKQALLDMDKQTIHQVSGWGNITRYQEVTDSDYAIIRDTAWVLGMDVTSADASR